MLVYVLAAMVLLQGQSGAHQPRLPDERRSVAPPASANANRTKALVNKAAALIEQHGKAAAFRELRLNGSEWFNGDTYLFAYDMDLNVLLNPAFPEREGRSLSGHRDGNGQRVHDEIRRVIQTAGAGWVKSRMPRPGSTQPVEKWVYVRRVSIDGTSAIVGSGFYPK
jgi:cytochrome c